MTEDRRPSVALKTLGCKLNQFETQQIRQQLSAMGCRIVAFEGLADIYVINSCTVTSRTDRDTRRLIRHAKKLNPRAFVAVTGCYAEVNPADLEAIPEADLVADNSAKAGLALQIKQRLDGALDWPLPPVVVHGPPFGGTGEMLTSFADHTRAFVKVQEGCDANCAYCIIPRARGPSRSVPPADVVEQVRRLADAGHPEIVLIGTHLGKYGQDGPDMPDLAALVTALCDIPQLGRLRLSSIEPREVSEALVQLVAGHPKVCRHFHIPMQSGCDTVLARMGRPYDSRLYADLICHIHQLEPRICLGADVMVGFPGETEEEFATTRDLISDLPLSYLHVFTYSPRPSTRAAEMPCQIEYEVKRARNHELRELSEAKRAAFANSLVGETLGAVLERPLATDPALLDGLTDNYLRIHATGEPSLLGSLQPMKIVSAEGAVLRARLE